MFSRKEKYNVHIEKVKSTVWKYGLRRNKLCSRGGPSRRVEQGN